MGLLQTIETFLRAHHMSPTRFGRLAINDPHLIRGLRRGRELRPGTVARIEGFLREETGR